MYKDFVNVTPDSGGAGVTSVGVAADENTGAARSTSLNITGGGVQRVVAINQAKELVECNIEIKYWTDAATSGSGNSIYLEAYADQDVTSDLKINFVVEQTGPTGEWEHSTPVEILINTGDNQSTTHEVQFYDYSFRFKDNAATITPTEDTEYFYSFVGFNEMFFAPQTGTWRINMISCEPNGAEQTNVNAVYAATLNTNYKRTLTFNSLNLVAFDETGNYNIHITFLQIQFQDTDGQVPYAISVRGSYVGASDPYMTTFNGNFQNGVIDAVFNTALKPDGANRGFHFRIQGQHV